MIYRKKLFKVQILTKNINGFKFCDSVHTINEVGVNRLLSHGV